MEDCDIIRLYWAREERALEETHRKYGSYCWTIAHNILRNREDSDECVNDTYLRAWNAMPPQRPAILPAFLGKITRNLSLDRCKAKGAARRGGGQLNIALEELGDCLSGGDTPEDALTAAELGKAIDRFLRTLPDKDCCVFLRRYWYLDNVGDIARRYHMAEGSVKSSLFRTRKKLRDYLQQEGVWA